MHASSDELRVRLTCARDQISIGSMYRHRKGGVYLVKDIVLLEATGEPAVLYCKEDSEDIVWVRELQNFLERFCISK